MTRGDCMSLSFEIRQVAKMIQTSPLRLNKLALACGVSASVEGGGKKGKRRHFSVRDICRLGLATWLWNAGLRVAAIRDATRKKASTTLLADLHRLADIKAEANRERFLVAVRYEGPKRGYREFMLVPSLHRAQAVLKEAIGVSVPIGKLLGDLGKRLEEFTHI
jgi:hypothetical protein